MFQRKAQANANGAAILIIVVTALIVLYILFLPPGDRAELLGESSGSSSSSNSHSSSSTKTLIKLMPSMTLLEENVGRINYLDSKERSHYLPSFTVSVRTDGSVLQNIDSLYVKASVFDSIIENVSFKIDTELTSDLKLSFNIGKEASGRLMMVLNGKQILNEILSPETSQYVSLPADILQRYNMLTVGVSSPGWAFWDVNEYQLNSLQITGDVKDLSGSQTRQSFILDDKEVENLDRALLKYYVDCQNSHGNLVIQVNARTVFSGRADCSILSTIELDTRILDWGENDLIFSTDSGNYLITNLEVKTILKEPVYPIFYFEMDDNYFTVKSNSNVVCGAIDDICPTGCSDDMDKDCCLSDDNYWCDLETAQFGDRCVSHVTVQTCDRCDAGYEDDRGRAASACEDSCGDDFDNDCPVGCSRYLDRDCCFEYDDKAYWCEDYPLGKPLSATCKLGVDTDERESCPDFYVNDHGKRLSFVKDNSNDDPDNLLSLYSVSLFFDFPNADLKSASLLINGREVGLETRNIDWERDISRYTRSGTNSIQIKPARSIDITSLKVSIDRD